MKFFEFGESLADFPDFDAIAEDPKWIEGDSFMVDKSSTDFCLGDLQFLVVVQLERWVQMQDVIHVHKL